MCNLRISGLLSYLSRATSIILIRSESDFAATFVETSPWVLFRRFATETELAYVFYFYLSPSINFSMKERNPMYLRFLVACWVSLSDSLKILSKLCSKLLKSSYYLNLSSSEHPANYTELSLQVFISDRRITPSRELVLKTDSLLLKSM